MLPGVTAAMTYTVPGIHCGHCERAVKEEVGAVAGVESVDVDLGTKLVSVRGDGLDDAELRAAIAEAGYEAA
jgi:copper chaperone